MNPTNSSSYSSLYDDLLCYEEAPLSGKENPALQKFTELYKTTITNLISITKITFTQLSSNFSLEFKKIEVITKKSRPLKLICLERATEREKICEKPAAIRKNLETLISSGLFSPQQIKFLKLGEISPSENMVDLLITLLELHKKIIACEMQSGNYITSYERALHNPVSWQFDYASFDKGIDLLVTKINSADFFEKNKPLLQEIQTMVLYFGQSVAENTKRTKNDMEIKLKILNKEDIKSAEKIQKYQNLIKNLNIMFISFSDILKEILRITDPSGEKIKDFRKKVQGTLDSAEESKISF